MDAEIRALTVRQPWAHFIAKQGKSVENRSRQVSYRGLLAIHAGSYGRWDRDAESSPVALETWKRWAGIFSDGSVRTPLTRGAAYNFFTFGAVIAVAELTGCHDATYALGWSCSPWAASYSWHWELAGVRRLAEPVPCRGMLGLWRLPDDVEKAVREQLEASDD